MTTLKPLAADRPKTMMRQYELVDRVRRYNPHADEDLLNRAYVYAMKAHGAQKRASGDPYFSHPLEVAAILTDLKLDDATIVAAVLHDTIEDTDSTREEIDRLFGAEIGEPRRWPDQAQEARSRLQARRAGARISASSCSPSPSDVRVLLVKLADRLHNMRTLHFVPAEKRAAHRARKRWTSTRRSPAAWACRACARSWRISPSAI